MNAVSKILVVDDLEPNLAAMKALLSGPRVEVLLAQSGDAALELLLSHDVALALLDVQMPNMDGFQLAELIRGVERTRSVPLIFLTAGNADQARSFRGYEAGAVDFLYKPVDTHVLRSKVQVFVELHAQRVRMAEQLEELRRAIRTNEMFTAVLGHDLRTPLSAVAVNAEILLRKHEDPDTRDIALRLRSSSQRMRRMIDQLLDVSKIREGGISLQRQSGDLAALCRDIVQELQVQAAGQGPAIQIETQGDAVASFDFDRVSQVLSNLLGNAVQHGDKTHPVTVVIDGSRADVVTVKVCNHGIIAPDLLERLFEPFKTSYLSHGAGLGLGLYIVEQFVRAHGGMVRVLSREPEQTRFEFSLPRLGAVGPTPAAPPQALLRAD